MMSLSGSKSIPSLKSDVSFDSTSISKKGTSDICSVVASWIALTSISNKGTSAFWLEDSSLKGFGRDIFFFSFLSALPDPSLGDSITKSGICSNLTCSLLSLSLLETLLLMLQINS